MLLIKVQKLVRAQPLIHFPVYQVNHLAHEAQTVQKQQLSHISPLQKAAASECVIKK